MLYDDNIVQLRLCLVGFVRPQVTSLYQTERGVSLRSGCCLLCERSEHAKFLLAIAES